MERKDDRVRVEGPIDEVNVPDKVNKCRVNQIILVQGGPGGS